MNDRSRSDSHAYGEVLKLLDVLRAETDDTERSRASAAWSVVTRENRQDFVTYKLVDISAAAMDYRRLLFKDTVQDAYDLFWSVALGV
jgi:hypothetical protein